jgi:hypothetical protein
MIHPAVGCAPSSSDRHPLRGIGSARIFVVVGPFDVTSHLRTVLGESVFDACVAVGAVWDVGEAVAYARLQIRVARQSLAPA